MLSLKPIYLWNYLGTKFHSIPSGIKRQFYLSYEDAIWHILSQKHIKKGSIILVPEFFCGDVEENIKSHGYQVRHYRVSKYLIASQTDFVHQLKRHHPTVVIIFHSVGISNHLLSHPLWTKHLSPDTIIIEDSVHRLIDSEKVLLIHPNHLIIDSLRKVTCLQGSVVYGNHDYLDFNEPGILQSIRYRHKVTTLWLLMNMFWLSSQITHGTKVSSSLAKTANYLMLRGYQLIGDSQLPARGSIIFSLIQRFVDPTKIEFIKSDQVQYYESQLSNLPKSIFSVPTYQSTDRSHLIAYPLVITPKFANKTVKTINNKGLMLRLELNDSVWSQRNKIIYLPLGPHLSSVDLDRVVTIIKSITNTSIRAGYPASNRGQ